MVDDAPPAESALPAGTVLDRYVILERLGVGAMGAVFAAYDPRLDRKIALKLLHARPPLELGNAADRLRREAQAMARLSHPNILRVHDVGTRAGRLYLTMDLVEGRTLKEWEVEQPRTWRAALGVLVQAGRGLAGAHAAGIVHRDFKPDNVLIGARGGVWVSDFGLARREAGQGGATATPGAGGAGDGVDVRLTHSGLVVGTPAYMAPEQHAGRAPDARADQFSFCVTAYEALYGHRPFRGESIDAITTAELRGEIVPPPARSRVPAWLRRVLLRGLAADPRERWVSMQELLDEIERRPAARRRRAVVLGGIAVVAAALAGAWVHRQWRVRECRTDAVALAGTWGDTTRAELARAFAATRRSEAEATRAAVEAALDRRARRWASAREQVCVAAHSRGGEEEGDRAKLVCLDARLAEQRTVIGALAEPVGDPVAIGAEAVDGLASIDACTGEAASAIVPAADPGVVERLATARGLALSGRFVAARELVGSELALARERDDMSVASAALLVSGEIEARAGERAAAEAALWEATWAAESSRRDRLAAEALARLAALVGRDASRLAEALVLHDDAGAAIHRAGADPALVRELEASLGRTLGDAGRLAEARTSLEHAIALHEQAEGDPDLVLAGALASLARVYARMGADELALPTAVRALAAAQAVYGREHRALQSYRDAVATLGEP